MADENNQQNVEEESQDQPETRPDTSSAHAAPDASDADQNKGLAIISYIGPLFIVPLLAAKDSQFAMFHANQGLLLFITAIVFWVAATILVLIPFLGLLVLFAGWVLLLVLFILGIVNAANGEMKELPIIGHFRILK